MTGDQISLSAANLRSVNLQLTGSGLGSWTKDNVRMLFSEILPEMLQLAADGNLKVDIKKVNLEDIETLWDEHMSDGQRLVVMM